MSAKWGQLGATKSGINTQQGHNTGTLVHTALPLACEGGGAQLHAVVYACVAGTPATCTYSNVNTSSTRHQVALAGGACLLLDNGAG